MFCETLRAGLWFDAILQKEKPPWLDHAQQGRIVTPFILLVGLRDPRW
jgi:hypothetical protein